MKIPNDPATAPPLGPQTGEEKEFREAQPDLDDVNPMMVWAAMLMQLVRRSKPMRADGPSQGEEPRP